MNDRMDLKQIEEKAFKSNYEDGVWDMYLGLLLGLLYLNDIFLSRIEASGTRIVVMLAIYALVWFFFWAVKRFVTTPRLGQAKFGPMRKRRRRVLFVVLSISVLLHVGLLTLTVAARSNPALGRLFASSDYLVPVGVSVWVSLIFVIMAYFLDFTRLYFYGLLFGLCLAASMMLDNSLVAGIGGGLMILTGAAIFARFLRDNPVLRHEAANG